MGSRTRIQGTSISETVLRDYNKFGTSKMTITANFTIPDKAPSVWWFDATATPRNIVLPTAEDGLFAFVFNESSSTAVLTVKDPAAVTVAILDPASVGIFFCIGSVTPVWYGAAVASSAFLEGVTAGTVAASKVVVVDANKDIAAFRNLRTVRTIHAEGAPISDNTAGARTFTAAEFLAGIIVRDPNGASRTDVLPTAAALVAAVPGATVGDVLDCLVINGADAAETITFTLGAGGTFDANATAVSRIVGQNASKLIRLRLTNVTGASEAYVAYT